MRFVDVLWFAAEFSSYAAVVGCALTRRRPLWQRAGLAVAGLTVFAFSWGRFAAPDADAALHGGAALAFKVAWFGAAAIAAAIWWRSVQRPKCT